nr:MAG TPA: hypothetical protein [Caudoviricetes sp.]
MKKSIKALIECVFWFSLLIALIAGSDIVRIAVIVFVCIYFGFVAYVWVTTKCVSGLVDLIRKFL